MARSRARSISSGARPGPGIDVIGAAGEIEVTGGAGAIDVICAAAGRATAQAQRDDTIATMILCFTTPSVAEGPGSRKTAGAHSAIERGRKSIALCEPASDLDAEVARHAFDLRPGLV